MFQTKTIHSDDGAVRLSCFTDDYKDIWIEFSEIKDKKYPDQDLEWDNPAFLFENFYPFLLKWKEKTTSPTDRIIHEEVLEYLESDESVVTELIEMFEEAIKQKWYEFKKEG